MFSKPFHLIFDFPKSREKETGKKMKPPEKETAGDDGAVAVDCSKLALGGGRRSC